ncbi:hypothetical protein [Chryseobacterium sp. Hurlbut01]|uniref:hypothetical protein n=1 Tax=Chryseobacterium sp. Hurlbut01 TaxID=1681828 RepID=UPI00067C0EDE|nr:hypothetical protein [Chryseobacterium sp. Hurlbut01]KNB62259.1 hypothetical protein AC804_05185 [Chryseobacterium sp. Hurlbut01]
MKFTHYLQNLDFESIISTTFLLPFFGIIVILKILSVILYSFVAEDDNDEEIPKVTIFSNWFSYLIVASTIMIMYDYFDRKEKLNFRFTHTIVIDNQNGKLTENYIDDGSETAEVLNSGNVNSSTFSWDDIDITPEAENLINNANLTEKYDGLSSEDLIKLKKIMSDPNPDPMKRDEEKCTMGTKECKWCGKQMNVEGKISTSKSLLRLVVHPKTDDPVEALARLFGVFDVNPKLCIQSYELADNYHQKYQCIVNDVKEFCSLKCEKEFKNNKGY